MKLTPKEIYELDAAKLHREMDSVRRAMANASTVEGQQGWARYYKMLERAKDCNFGPPWAAIKYIGGGK